MDLVSETPTELYFHKLPVKVQLLAGAFFIAGVVIILFLGWKTEIRCNCVIPSTHKSDTPTEGKKRECDGWCNITHTNLWMYNTYNIRTPNIRAALLEGSGYTYRVVLLLSTQDEEMMEDENDVGGEQISILPYYSYSGYQIKRRIATKINMLVSGLWHIIESGDIVVREVADDRW